ncbi:MAG: sugar phosphate isomerase/epimerase [Gemmataceae bacterium]|nr:sugar phosphate isomerase/epimerase [Gemmataceae bacterium]
MTPSRRDFLLTSAAGVVAAPLARAIEPIKRPGPKPDLKLGLAAYSFRQFLTGKTPEMTLFDFIDLAAGLPLDGVELTSYYFAATDDGYLDKLKAHAAAKKLAISGVPVGNNFCVRDEARRRTEIDLVKAWVGRAARLGAKTVRIFAGNQEKGDTLADAQKRVVSALEECCPVAEKAGVVLALENHGGITDTPDHLLDLVRPVTSPALGVNIDTGNFHTPDPYADVARIAPYGVVCQVKTEVTPAGGKKQDADLGRVVKILKDANYHGFVVLEYEAAEDPKVAVPRHVRELRKLIG